MSVTREDAQNVMNYCMAFGIPLPTDDVVFLFNTYINHDDEDKLDEDTEQRLKILCCKMIVTNDHPSFADDLWKGPKEASQLILDEIGAAIAEGLSKDE